MIPAVPPTTSHSEELPIKVSPADIATGSPRSPRSPREKFEPQSPKESPRSPRNSISGSLKKGSWINLRSKKDKSPQSSLDDSAIESSPEPGLRRWATRRQTITERPSFDEESSM